MIEKITFGHSNCYLIKQNEQFLLIDTELPTKASELILELEKRGVTKENFKLVVLTHGHVDHVGNAEALRSHFGVQIAIGKNDADMVRTADVTFPKAHRFFTKVLRSVLAKKNTKFIYEPFEPDLLLDENDSLEQYGFDAWIVSLTGHTAGSIGIVVGADIFPGDAGMMMNEKLSAPIFGESCEQMSKSLAKIKAFGLEHIHTGH